MQKNTAERIRLNINWYEKKVIMNCRNFETNVREFFIQEMNDSEFYEAEYKVEFQETLENVMSSLKSYFEKYDLDIEDCIYGIDKKHPGHSTLLLSYIYKIAENIFFEVDRCIKPEIRIELLNEIRSKELKKNDYNYVEFFNVIVKQVNETVNKFSSPKASTVKAVSYVRKSTPSHVAKEKYEEYKRRKAIKLVNESQLESNEKYEAALAWARLMSDNANKNNKKTRKEIKTEEYDYVDVGEIISNDLLEKARAELHENQKMLVIEDDSLIIYETDEQLHLEEENDDFDCQEIMFLSNLLNSANIREELLKLKNRHILPEVLIEQINKKAIDLFGDIVIQGDSIPYILPEYMDVCKEWVKKYGRI